MSHFRFDPTIDFVTARAYVPDHGMLPAFAGDSSYVEHVYAGVVGPTGLLAYRRLLRTVTAQQGSVLVGVDELGASLGVKREVILRALERLVRFRFAHWDASVLELHTRIPIVDAYHFERLSATAKADHYQLVRELLAAG